ncbi:MAG: hypothetical protein RIR18_1240 [Pseudomonadota bacterium]|jgi:hemerythrin-like metal-binding protein
MSLQFLKTWHKCFARHIDFMASGIEPLNIPFEQVSDDAVCKLGGWLIQKEDELLRYPEYLNVVESHRQFHRIAGEVVKHHAANSPEELAEWLPKLIATSEEVVKKIGELEHAVTASGSAPLEARSFDQLSLHNSVWQESLLIGVPVIDIQHQGLAQMIDTILSSKEKLGSKVGAEFLGNFSRLYLLHLKTEEAYLRRSNISESEYSAHLVEHELCKAKIAELSKSNNYETTLSEIKSTMVDVLVGHMQYDAQHLSSLVTLA